MELNNDGESVLYCSRVYCFYYFGQLVSTCNCLLHHIVKTEMCMLVSMATRTAKTVVVQRT